MNNQPVPIGLIRLAEQVIAAAVVGIECALADNQPEKAQKYLDLIKSTMAELVSDD